MAPRTRFILNDREVETEAPAGLLVLDFLRNCERLTGTKEGCKEGDCGRVCDPDRGAGGSRGPLPAGHLLLGAAGRGARQTRGDHRRL